MRTILIKKYGHISIIIVDYILNDNTYASNADMNNDSVLNVADVIIIIGIILN